MQKNPITDVIQTEENKPKKQKKNKHPTACVDKTRMFDHCGICGSKNIIWFGVSGCEECGKEKDFIIEGYSWWSRNFNETRIGCNCSKKRYSEYRIELEACIDCGAHKGVICPACKMRATWISKLGDKKFCRYCGYRS